MARPRRLDADSSTGHIATRSKYGRSGGDHGDSNNNNNNDDDDGIELHTAMTSQDQQPLLTGDDADDNTVLRHPDDFADDDFPKPPDTSSSPGIYVWLLTLSAGLSGMLFGYDTGVISATLVSIGSALSGRPLTSLDKSVITSATSLLALLASPAASVLADARGRRRVILAADALFIVGALLQAAASSVAVMVLGRAIVGAAVGAASFVIPLYIAEAAPAEHRGRLVTVNVLFITLGQVAAYVLGWLLAAYGNAATAWRWMVGLGAVPALLQAFLVLFMPESPRWLVRAGRAAEARAVIAQVQGSANRSHSASVNAIVKEIETQVRQEEAAPAASAWSALLGVRRNRRALTIACLLQGLQQLCGFNSLMYFSATIFTLVGFGQPTLTALTVAATNFVFTVAALLVVDRIGRRRVLLYSIPVMAVGLVLAAYGFSFLDLNATNNDSKDSNGAVLILVSIMLYVGAYAIGLGNVPWMQSELFALNVRSLGSGLATATNWGANFVVGLTFLPLMDALTPSWTFVLYAAVCGVGFFLVQACYPETSGLSLEEAAGLLDADDWGVSRRR